MGFGLIFSSFWYFPDISALFVIVSITPGNTVTTDVRMPA